MEVLYGFKGKIMGIYIYMDMGIPGLVICSRLRTGKWHMKTSLLVYLEDHPSGEG